MNKLKITERIQLHSVLLFGGESGIWTLATLFMPYEISSHASSTTWVTLRTCQVIIPAGTEKIKLFRRILGSFSQAPKQASPFRKSRDSFPAGGDGGSWCSFWCRFWYRWNYRRICPPERTGGSSKTDNWRFRGLHWGGRESIRIPDSGKSHNGSWLRLISFFFALLAWMCYTHQKGGGACVCWSMGTAAPWWILRWSFAESGIYIVFCCATLPMNSIGKALRRWPLTKGPTV